MVKGTESSPKGALSCSTSQFLFPTETNETTISVPPGCLSGSLQGNLRQKEISSAQPQQIPQHVVKTSGQTGGCRHAMLKFWRIFESYHAGKNRGTSLSSPQEWEGKNNMFPCMGVSWVMGYPVITIVSKSWSSMFLG